MRLYIFVGRKLIVFKRQPWNAGGGTKKKAKRKNVKVQR